MVVAPRRGSAGRTPSRRRLGVVVTVAALVVGVVGVAGSPAGAQADDLDVTVVAGPGFPERTDVEVTIVDLGDFDGGRAVVYQCANADASGAPITPTEDDCFTPDNEANYLVLPIAGDTVEVTYPLRLSGIGANSASCVTLPPATVSCLLVVAASKDDAAILTGVSVDELVARAQPSEMDGLPVTGADLRLVVPLTAAGAVSLYLGWFAWSAAAPGRRVARVPVR